MANINQIILQELELSDISNHLMTHKHKYLAALGALALGVGGHKAYKMYKHHKQNKSILGHLNRNRETYAGGAIGGISSLASSSGQPIMNRLGKAAFWSAVGGLTGSGINAIRRNNEHATELKNK